MAMWRRQKGLMPNSQRGQLAKTLALMKVNLSFRPKARARTQVKAKPTKAHRSKLRTSKPSWRRSNRRSQPTTEVKPPPMEPRRRRKRRKRRRRRLLGRATSCSTPRCLSLPLSSSLVSHHRQQPCHSICPCPRMLSKA